MAKRIFAPPLVMLDLPLAKMIFALPPVIFALPVVILPLPVAMVDLLLTFLAGQPNPPAKPTDKTVANVRKARMIFARLVGRSEDPCAPGLAGWQTGPTVYRNLSGIVSSF